MPGLLAGAARESGAGDDSERVRTRGVVLTHEGVTMRKNHVERFSYRVRLRFPGPGYVLHVSRRVIAQTPAAALGVALVETTGPGAPGWVRRMPWGYVSGSVRRLVGPRKGE